MRMMTIVSFLFMVVLAGCETTTQPKKQTFHVYFDLDSAINYPKYASWVVLDLSYRNLDSLPATIGKAVSVGSMVLKYNKLMKLPDQIKDCISLVAIDLSNNLFSEFPIIRKDIVLYRLENNAIVSVPMGLSDYEVDRLYLRNNNIVYWPDSLKLKGPAHNDGQPIQIDLRGNPLSATQVEKVRRLMPKTQVLF